MCLLGSVLMITGCEKHPYEAEWQAQYDVCVHAAESQLLSMGEMNADTDEMVRTACSDAIYDLTKEYSTSPPEAVPDSEISEAFDAAIEDCLKKDFLESEAC